MKIENVKLFNAFWNHNELTISGKSIIDVIYVHKGVQKKVIEPNRCIAGVYDGSQYLGLIYLPCSGNSELWKMTNIIIILPEKTFV